MFSLADLCARAGNTRVLNLEMRMAPPHVPAGASFSYEVVESSRWLLGDSFIFFHVT